MIFAGSVNNLFQLPVPALDKVVRALIIYAFLVVALRLGGKREMAQLNALDFVVLLAVANAVQNGIIGNDNSVTGAVLGATVFLAANTVMAVLVFRHRRWRRVIEGSATVLISDGCVDQTALRHERLTEEDLLVAVEKEGATSFEDVALAVLEPSGSIVTVIQTPTPEQQHYEELTGQLSDLRESVGQLSVALSRLTETTPTDRSETT